MEPIRMKYEVRSDDFSVAGEASGKIKRTLKDLGLDASVVRNVAIAVYEGEINMVIHANGGYIEVEINPDKIKIVLKDSGPGIPDVEKAMQAGFSTAPENIRALGFGAGMGLPNIKKYSDEMNIDTELGVGTTITLGFNI